MFSSSNLTANVFDNNGTLYASNEPVLNLGNITIAKTAKQVFTVVFEGPSGQKPPFASNVVIDSNLGNIVDVGSTSVPNTSKAGGFRVIFSLENTETNPNQVATVTATITTPKGIVSRVTFNVNLD